ncbi:MAG: hypothetical protein WCO27_01335 [Actinomycetes bacterium]|jgi:hypothetical protein
MAMTALAPRISHTRKKVAQRAAKVALSIAPDVAPGEKVERGYFVAFVSAVGVLGLLVLLFVNTLSDQDAFQLRRLQTLATTQSDQREATNRAIARVSSPERLASAAHALGMVSSENPNFLTITDSTEKKG